MGTEKCQNQFILNRIGIRYFKKAKELTSETELKKFSDKCISMLEQGNSNVSYEQLQQLSRFNNEQNITTEGAVKQLRSTYHEFITIFSKCIGRLKRQGDLSKVDVDIIDETFKDNKKVEK